MPKQYTIMEKEVILYFYLLNCGALPENLIESELFGYEKGAFTGATAKKIGKFEYSSGGTLFLDEISELSLNIQAKLLRVLQDKVVNPLGSNMQIKVNPKIVAATNKDLKEYVKKGLFRDDLFYRLNVINIHLPPLRERKEDILFLASYFITKFNKIYDKNIEFMSKSFYNYLISNKWQGNIRELENFIERCIILSKNDIP